jgi:hypothetical protein
MFNFFDRLEYSLNLNQEKNHFLKVTSILLIGIALVFFFMNYYWNNEKENRDKYLNRLVVLH